MTELALIFGSGVLGLAFAAYLARWVSACPAGDAPTIRVAGRIRSVAEGFLRRQNSTIGAVSAVLAAAVFLAYGLLRGQGDEGPVAPLELGVWLSVSVAVGAAACVAAAHVAGWTATRTSPRAAMGARRSVDQALQIAIRGGAVSGLFVVTTGLIGLALLVAAVLAYKGAFGADPAVALRLAPSVPMMVAGYALGASFAALLAQLGGGTFAKAADVAADLVAMENRLGDDDARNPVVVADLAGDAVGDAAARAAGLFAATVAENLGAMLAGAALYRENASLKSAFAVMLFPLVTRGFAVLATVFGVMVVRTDDRENPLAAMSRGLYVTATLHAVGFAGAAKWLLGAHWLSFFAAGLLGIAAAVALFHLTQYATESRYPPVRDLAEASRGGPTLSVLHGLAGGIESTLAPCAVIAVAALGAHSLGVRTGLAAGGLFGTAVATMGMLGTIGYVLAMDAFGPILDAAAGIVELTVAAERPDVRGRALVLDAVGNSVKAVTKACGAGSASMSALLLVGAYLDDVRRRAVAKGLTVAPGPIRVERLEQLLCATIGVLLVLWLCSRCILGVARTARRVIDEARRQLSREAPEQPGGPERGAPGGAPVVDILARAALRFMIAPAVVAASAPIVVGIALRLARTEDNPVLAADSVAALVLAGTIAGSLGSLLLGNAGGAWDNAKKYIATGAHGGRHLVDEGGRSVDNPAYVAALVGDTVGDPLKDTAGPAMHVLVKMLPVVTLVFLPFFV